MNEFNVKIDESTAIDITIACLKHFADEYPPEEREHQFQQACKEIFHFIMKPQEWEERYDDNFVKYVEEERDVLVHEFFGADEYKNRQATVKVNEQGFYVEMYLDDEFEERRNLYKHSEQYAEKCAENWVMGVIN